MKCEAFTKTKKNNIMSITSRILSFMSILFVGFLTSCVQDDDYKVPTVEIVEPNITANTTINIVKAMSTTTNPFVDFSQSNNGGELIFEGYVVSNDEAGNIYKILAIQDAPENPTAAIQLDIDDTSLYDLYKPGRKVYIKLNPAGVPALGMTNLNGVLHIGQIQGASVGRISSNNYEKYIFRSSEIATLVPKLITPADYDSSLVNMLVQIDNMQLTLDQVGMPYANAGDTFTVNRLLKNCDDDSQTIIRNSGFADFKGELFPTGKGSVVALFSKYNNDYQLLIRDTDDVKFDGERCDPVVLNCTGTTSTADVLFSENFEGTSEATLTSEGWINLNANGGNFKFSLRNFGGNSYMQASAFNSNENPYEAWLITPPVSLDASEAEQLTFKTNAGFYNGAALSVYVSTDFTGNAADIDNATWMLVSANLAQGPSSGYGTTFINSGVINLSCLEGNVYVAFNYVGSGSGISSTFQIDDVIITGNL